MELNDTDAAVCADSINPQSGEGSAGEIELYDELIAFAELPPDEQARSESSPPAADNDQECPVLTHAPDEPEISVNQADTPAEEEPTEQSSPEQLLPSSALGLVESEAAAVEKQATPCEEAEQISSPEWTLTGSPVQSVESVTAVPATESACVSEVLNESVETSDVRTQHVEAPRPSGPLSGFNLPPEIVYMGAMSRGVCLACGAESGADDLFCLTCGDFIDEVASTLPSNPTCEECKQQIDADEIFCPWCGSARQAQR